MHVFDMAEDDYSHPKTPQSTTVQLDFKGYIHIGADSKLAPSQPETSLQSNTVSYWLGANL